MFSGIVFNPEFQLGYTCATLCHIFARSGIVETHVKIKVRPDLVSVSEKGSGQNHGTFRKQGRFLVILGHLLISWLIRLMKVYQFGQITE